MPCSSTSAPAACSSNASAVSPSLPPVNPVNPVQRFMKPLYDFSRLTVDRILAPRDSMVAAEKPGEYFDLGRRALELIQFSAELCDKPHYPEILDLPCGHGRVLRWLRAHYDYAKITASDLDRDGVDFCARQFRALPVYSKPDLKQLQFTAQFDLIWVGSLVTHLNCERWLATLD